ncbi:hypothetical protein PISL3812_08168 [Talaromyces islandicus]|uniref:Apple domain-containing protein n=1 Tax=Talaromyces islandicus TaxID=28573 RepID=A0A0U1M829_TALIS|nr:hypothetical protein PISL3812_08168 [Talaromyces islandicus]
MKLRDIFTWAGTFAVALAAPVTPDDKCSALRLLLTEQQHKDASNWCSAHLKPATVTSGAASVSVSATTTTSTIFVTSTKIDTITSESASVIYTFLPGNPPTSTSPTSSHTNDNINKRQPSGDSSPTPTAFALWIAAQPSTSVSALCSCLGVSEKSSKPTTPVTKTVTQTSTVTKSTTVAAAASVSSVWPCASPFPTLTPTSPYGNASIPSSLATENTLFHRGDSTAGASAQACCNACYFDLPNCIQAYWYSYEGCVVSQATNVSVPHAASGHDVSSVCPAGTFTVGDVHKLLIDVYFLRMEDEHNLDGMVGCYSIYGGRNGFRRFLTLMVSRGGLLPTWWTPGKEE